MLKCRQQDVKTDDEFLERMLLSRPNERYSFIKNNYLHSAVQQDLEHIFSSLRVVVFEFQRKEGTSSARSATFAEAVQVEVERQNAAATEVLWAQHGKNTSRLAGGRPANPSTICYCCTDKGHYARDCKHFKSTCKFCKRTGHMEIACRPSIGYLSSIYTKLAQHSCWDK